MSAGIMDFMEIFAKRSDVGWKRKKGPEKTEQVCLIFMEL